MHGNGTALVVMADPYTASPTPAITEDSAPATKTALTLVREISSGDGDNTFSFVNNRTIDELEKCHDGQLLNQHKMATGNAIPKHWILLDNKSTVNVICNKDLLTNVWQAPNMCRISCNAGVVVTNFIGDLARYTALAWYNLRG